MAHLIVTVEDSSSPTDLDNLKQAIGMLRGVSSVETSEGDFRTETLSAMREALEGRTIKCGSFEDYLEKVK